MDTAERLLREMRKRMRSFEYYADPIEYRSAYEDGWKACENAMLYFIESKESAAGKCPAIFVTDMNGNTLWWCPECPGDKVQEGKCFHGKAPSAPTVLEEPIPQMSEVHGVLIVQYEDYKKLRSLLAQREEEIKRITELHKGLMAEADRRLEAAERGRKD